MVPSSQQPADRRSVGSRLTAISSAESGRAEAPELKRDGFKEELFAVALEDARRSSEVNAADSLWRGIRFLDWSGSTLHLEITDATLRSAFERRVRPPLEVALAQTVGSAVKVRLHVSVAPPRRRRWRGSRAIAPLGDFIVDEPNRAAHRFLLTYRGGRALFDPCVFYGPAGAGKTHLLRAFSARCRADQGGREVRYLTAAGLGRGYRASLHTGRLDAFRREVETPELLLIDALEAIANEPGTQRELARALRRRAEVGGATVVAGRSLPTEIDGLDAGLASRLMAGLVVKMGCARPEAITRALKSRLLKRGVRVGAAVLERAAELAAGAPTVAESIVLRAIAEHDPPISEEDLAPVREEPGRAPSLDWARIRRIAGRIASTFGVTVDDLESPRKHHRAQVPRCLLALVLRERFAMTAAEIGRNLGRRSVSTVTKMLRRARAAVADDPATGEWVAEWIRSA